MIHDGQSVFHEKYEPLDCLLHGKLDFLYKCSHVRWQIIYFMKHMNLFSKDILVTIFRFIISFFEDKN
jgi:hypothetical protein